MKKVRLEDICNCISSNISQKDVMVLNGKYPVYGASGKIKNINFYKYDKPYIAVVKDGSGVGRIMILPAKSSIISTMQYLLPKENVNLRYLYYAIKSLDLTKYSKGIAIPHIYFRDYKKEEIYLPKIREQIEIANILDKTQEMIDIRKKQIEKFVELIKSQFVEMFGDCKNKDLIGNRISICRGASPRPINQYITENENGVNWIKIGDIDENAVYVESTKEKITIEGAKKSRYVKKGDFILSNSMSFGRPYILNIDGCVHDGWLIMSEFSADFNPLYLYYAIRDDEVQNQFNGKVNGATVKNLNSDLVKNTFIKIPPIKLQNQFAELIKQIDKQKFEIQKSLEEIQKLQESLINKYFE